MTLIAKWTVSEKIDALSFADDERKNMTEALRSLANVASAFGNTPVGPGVELLDGLAASLDALAEAVAAPPAAEERTSAAG